MSATTYTHGRSLARIYALEAKYEFLKLWRLPAYVIPTLTFPLVFYLFFGVAMAKKMAGGFPIGTYLLATYGTFGVMGCCLYGFGVGVATERGQGWMLFKRATPMPPLAHLAGKLAMCVLFGALVVAGLFVLGVTVGGVQVPLPSLLRLFALTISGALPFGALGLVLGNWAGPNSAPGLVNLVYLPMAICSGLWIPIQALPELIQRLAPIFPAYHLSQLGLGILGLGRPELVPARSVAFLALFTLAALALAWIGYRRDEGRTFG
jgi:ABC-2 type transport system permease protein